MKKRRLLLAAAALFLGLLAGPAFAARSDTPKFCLDFVDAYLVYDVGTGKLQVAAEGNVLNYGELWTVLKPGPGVFHLRNLAMEAADCYWRVYTDPRLKRAFRVMGGMFGEPGGTETPLYCKVEVYGGSPGSRLPDRFILRFVPESKAHLVCQKGGVLGTVKIFAEKDVLSSGGDWSINYFSSGYLCHLKQGHWKGFLWRIDLVQKKAWRMSGGGDGSSAILTPLNCGIRVIL
jgi:hypothetical protein